MDSVYVDNFQDAEMFCLSAMSDIDCTCTPAVVLPCAEAGTAAVAVAAAAAAVAAAVPAAVAEKG
jgi:hypothetical protein